MLAFLSYFTADTTTSMILMSLAIILCTFFFEDLAIIIVGILTADGYISIPVALLSLLVGSLLADATLHTIGTLARTHSRFIRYVDHDFTAPFRAWFTKRHTFIILSAHFVPGLRSTSYISSGFFGHTFSSFFPKAVASGVLLIATLFTASYIFGTVASQWLGHARWGVVLGFVIVLFFIGRHNLLSYHAKQKDLGL